MYSIEWTKTAVKQLRGIQPPKQRMAILDAVQGLANCPTNAANVKALKRRRAGYRLRVGRYRVLFDLDDGVRIITVQEVKKRDERTYQN
ncbi:MAG: cytotoxic translational repressor of toxin-antitoxin stability system [Alcanivorax sp.]|nr:cytotoxic translational repressor of toxin-antitoxin stability system [Alcanivorax sp.]MBM1142888.1 type II toxin-antitoxin system RelE/ParE family toxin [Alcanivorax sp. ZXX171]MAY09918.1 cytotoxic translational repressor of toxin-antitoxin stability system [Alcanivorax sp.]MBI54642.1 cytotoxic translational repressor of toxin-antitoxin stability system [Alcanivorax sp.]MBU59215.1 cytotoxic translational repressor of toxin-antitoxin stability system [Alcanivorax sp.]|tara:strand:+ start:15838 stop:16104 length:267 start_codon:yes stop_codon:yes gene_type:complete